MSADIEKLAVFDDRIIQTRPRYAVEKGALSLTNSPFNAISQSQSQHTYNIYVPSENVYVGRELEWSSTVYLALTVNCSDTQGGDYPINEPLFTFGVDGSMAAFPLNALCATMTATINDTTTTINSQDVLTEVLRLCDYRGNRLQRTCPTMLDKYQENSAAFGAQNDPCSGYTNMAHDYGEVPNGAYYNVAYTNPAGAVLPKTVNALAYTTPSGVKVATNQFGVPITRLQDSGFASASYTVYLKVRTTEKLVLSPFIFAEEHGCDTGLFGINNIQLVMNMRDPTRCMRLRNSVSGSAQKVYYSGTDNTNWSTPLAYNTQVTGGAFTDSVVNVTFLTPSLDIPLPPKSVVPYTEFPRYITQPQNSEIAAGAVGQLQSQTITLPQIPDLFVIYVKPVASQTSLNIDRAYDPTLPQFGSCYLPVQTSRNGNRTVSPLSVNFDNFSGLLSSQTAEQLYAMSVRNGLDMDWNTWAGLGRVANTAGPQEISTVGGLLVLKPSTDITLQSGQAPSLVGNFTFQFNLSVLNTFPFAVNAQIYVITVNSGFFESIRGSSRIIKGVLSEQDIIAAPLAPSGTRATLARMIGGKMLSVANRLGMLKNGSEKSDKEGGALMGKSNLMDKVRSFKKVGGAAGLSNRLM